ncbi:MAG: Uma2 family endonuclease [Spirulinaceae cyanobacterium]
MNTTTFKNPPPLENGDRLTRLEFERRYQRMGKVKKAELIEGIVYMASPVRITVHGRPHAMIMALLGTYWAATPGVDLGDNPTVRLDADNEPQPDALLRREEAKGGNSSIDEDGYVVGGPELIVEIAASSSSYDLGDKLQAYRRNGVQEYLVWRVYDRRLDWFKLQQGRYISLEADEVGIVRSEIFPGLWLAIPALIEGNLAQALKVLQEGINSPQHSTFKEELNQKTL